MTGVRFPLPAPIKKVSACLMLFLLHEPATYLVPAPIKASPPGGVFILGKNKKHHDKTVTLFGKNFQSFYLDSLFHRSKAATELRIKRKATKMYGKFLAIQT